MSLEKFAQGCRRLIDNTGWALWYRSIQLLFAIIVLALVAFALSHFDPWVWGRISVAFAAWAIVSLAGRIALTRSSRYSGTRWTDYITLVLELINYVFFLMIVEGMAFTVRPGSKYRYCIEADGVTRISSSECNAIYATLAFAGIDLLLSFMAGFAIGFVLRRELIIKSYRRSEDRQILPEQAGQV